MRKPTHVYVGYTPCGCSQAIVVYSYEMRQHTASMVAEFIRDGLIVKSVTWEEYRAGTGRLVDCPHGEMVNGKEMQLALAMDTTQAAQNAP